MNFSRILKMFLPLILSMYSSLIQNATLNMVSRACKSFLILFVCHYRSLIYSYIFGDSPFHYVMSAWLKTIANYAFIKKEHENHFHNFDDVDLKYVKED